MKTNHSTVATLCLNMFGTNVSADHEIEVVGTGRLTAHFFQGSHHVTFMIK